MKFNIYFDDGVILPTEDMKTAFKACDMPDRVAAVTAVNYNGTEEVLWGEKPCETAPDKSGHWTYPHPIVTNATIDEVGFKAPFVLEAKVHNKETDQYETLYYELDATGFKNATKDVETIVANKDSDWTRTKRILTARFFSNKNGQFNLEGSFNFAF